MNTKSFVKELVFCMLVLLMIGADVPTARAAEYQYISDQYISDVHVTSVNIALAHSQNGVTVLSTTLNHIISASPYQYNGYETDKIYIEGNYLYCLDSLGLIICSWSATNITYLGKFKLKTTTGYNSFAGQDVLVNGNIVYAVTSDLIYIINATSKTAPKSLANITGSYWYSVACFGNNLLAMDGSALKMYDVSNASAPTLITSYTSKSYYSSYFLFADSLVFIASSDAIEIVSVTATSFSYLTTVDHDGSIPVYYYDNYLFRGSSKGLYVIDLHTITSPKILTPYKVEDAWVGEVYGIGYDIIFKAYGGLYRQNLVDHIESANAFRIWNILPILLAGIFVFFVTWEMKAIKQI